MAEGRVKWFNDKKGYGFIETSEGQDVFVHYTSIEGVGFKSLREGEKVSFEVERGKKGTAGSQCATAVSGRIKGKPRNELKPGSPPGFFVSCSSPAGGTLPTWGPLPYSLTGKVKLTVENPPF